MPSPEDATLRPSFSPPRAELEYSRDRQQRLLEELAAAAERLAGDNLSLSRELASARDAAEASAAAEREQRRRVAGLQALYLAHTRDAAAGGGAAGGGAQRGVLEDELAAGALARDLRRSRPPDAFRPGPEELLSTALASVPAAAISAAAAAAASPGVGGAAGAWADPVRLANRLAHVQRELKRKTARVCELEEEARAAAERLREERAGGRAAQQRLSAALEGALRRLQWLLLQQSELSKAMEEKERYCAGIETRLLQLHRRGAARARAERQAASRPGAGAAAAPAAPVAGPGSGPRERPPPRAGQPPARRSLDLRRPPSAPTSPPPAAGGATIFPKGGRAEDSLFDSSDSSDADGEESDSLFSLRPAGSRAHPPALTALCQPCRVPPFRRLRSRFFAHSLPLLERIAALAVNPKASPRHAFAGRHIPVPPALAVSRDGGGSASASSGAPASPAHFRGVDSAADDVDAGLHEIHEFIGYLQQLHAAAVVTLSPARSAAPPATEDDASAAALLVLSPASSVSAGGAEAEETQGPAADMSSRTALGTPPHQPDDAVWSREASSRRALSPSLSPRGQGHEPHPPAGYSGSARREQPLAVPAAARHVSASSSSSGFDERPPRAALSSASPAGVAGDAAAGVLVTAQSSPRQVANAPPVLGDPEAELRGDVRSAGAAGAAPHDFATRPAGRGRRSDAKASAAGGASRGAAADDAKSRRRRG